MWLTEVGKHPDLGRQPDAVLVGDVHRQQWQLPVHQQRHEVSGQNVALHDVERLNQDAETGERSAAGSPGRHCCRASAPCEWSGPRAALLEAQRIGIVGEVVDQHVVAGEIGRMLGPPVPRKIGRCGGQHAPHLADAADDDVGSGSCSRVQIATSMPASMKSG